MTYHQVRELAGSDGALGFLLEGALGAIGRQQAQAVFNADRLGLHPVGGRNACIAKSRSSLVDRRLAAKLAGRRPRGGRCRA